MKYTPGKNSNVRRGRYISDGPWKLAHPFSVVSLLIASWLGSEIWHEHPTLCPNLRGVSQVWGDPLGLWLYIWVWTQQKTRPNMSQCAWGHAVLIYFYNLRTWAIFHGVTYSATLWTTIKEANHHVQDTFMNNSLIFMEMRNISYV